MLQQLYTIVDYVVYTYFQLLLGGSIVIVYATPPHLYRQSEISARMHAHTSSVAQNRAHLCSILKTGRTLKQLILSQKEAILYCYLAKQHTCITLCRAIMV